MLRGHISSTIFTMYTPLAFCSKCMGWSNCMYILQITAGIDLFLNPPGSNLHPSMRALALRHHLYSAQRLSRSTVALNARLNARNAQWYNVYISWFCSKQHKSFIDTRYQINVTYATQVLTQQKCKKYRDKLTRNFSELSNVYVDHTSGLWLPKVSISCYVV